MTGIQITKQDEKKYLLPTARDRKILLQCKLLLSSNINKEDKKYIQCILTQLEDDWRKPLEQELQRLSDKYNVSRI